MTVVPGLAEIDFGDFEGRTADEMESDAAYRAGYDAQADALKRIRPLLTEEEAAVVRRGQNAKAHHAVPHGIQHRVYNQATAFEALLGSLYLSGQAERLWQLLSTAMEGIQ